MDDDREGKIKIRTLETDPSQAQCKPFEAQRKRVRHPPGEEDAGAVRVSVY
jgi:hypothetical protein